MDHPNIVKIYQFYPKDPAYYYMVLEYMVGGELFDRIVKKVWSPHLPPSRFSVLSAVCCLSIMKRTGQYPAPAPAPLA